VNNHGLFIVYTKMLRQGRQELHNWLSSANWCIDRPCDETIDSKSTM